MAMTSEEKFYTTQKNFNTVAIPTTHTATAFAPGARYAIVKDSFERDPLSRSNTIVELGCSNGENLMWLKENYSFSKAIGIDLCFSQVINNESGDFFLPANLNQAWPLESQGVDTIIAMMLIEHLFDPYHSFREIKRVLAPSGRAFINLPLITSIKNRLRLLVGHIPITSVPYERWSQEGHWDGFHLHYFTIPTIVDLAYGAGLRVHQAKSVGKFHRIKNIYPSLLCDEISLELHHSSI